MTASTRLAVVLGGALGTLARAGLAELPRQGGLPIGTLVANLVGALALGVVAGWLGPRRSEPRWAPVTAGLIGATTTFSTFAVEVADLLVDRPALGIAYAAGSVALGLALIRAGGMLGTMLSSTERPRHP